MERTSTGLLDLLNDRFVELQYFVQDSELLTSLNDYLNRMVDDSGQNRRLLGEMLERAKSQENRMLITEVVAPSVKWPRSRSTWG